MPVLAAAIPALISAAGSGLSALGAAGLGGSLISAGTGLASAMGLGAGLSGAGAIMGAGLTSTFGATIGGGLSSLLGLGGGAGAGAVAASTPGMAAAAYGMTGPIAAEVAAAEAAAIPAWTSSLFGAGAAAPALESAGVAASTPATAGSFGVGKLMNLAATGMNLLGTNTQANAAKRQAEIQGKIYDQNADVAIQQAEGAQIQGKAKAAQISAARRKMVGQQIAGYGGAGVDTGVGTPLDVIADTVSNFEQDLLTTGYNTDTAIRHYGSQADIYRWSAARAYETAGINYLTSWTEGLTKSARLLGSSGSFFKDSLLFD